jgi:hypothetical protein
MGSGRGARVFVESPLAADLGVRRTQRCRCSVERNGPPMLGL